METYSVVWFDHTENYFEKFFNSEIECEIFSEKLFNEQYIESMFISIETHSTVNIKER